MLSFPVIIAAILGIAILSGIAFSNFYSNSNKPYYFAIALVVIVLWFMVVYWFCSTGNSNLGWFFLILPFGMVLVWFLAQWLDRISLSS